MEKINLELQEAVNYLKEIRLQIEQLERNLDILKLLFERINQLLKYSHREEVIYELIERIMANLQKTVYCEEKIIFHKKKIGKMEFIISILNKNAPRLR